MVVEMFEWRSNNVEGSVKS